MQKLSRRDVFRATAGFAVAAPAVFRVTQVRAADFSLKYANNSPVTHPLTIRTVEAMDAIRKETGGKVDIQVFPNNQLGGDTDMLSQLRSGAIEFFTLSPLILSTLVPGASITGIGFAWSGYDKVWPAMDGELGDAVRGPDPEGRPRRLPEACATTASARSPRRQADQFARRPQGLQDPRPAEPALDLDVQGLRLGADADQLLRGLFGAADQGREGQENPLAIIRRQSSTRCRNTAR